MRTSNHKREQYHALIESLDSVLEGETDLVANFANASALLFHTLDNLNWAGFYLNRNEELVVGPFQGKPACVRIAFGKGVCGTAALTRKPVIVPDVRQFPGHIACDADSRSEIVVPLIFGSNLVGVLDLDSPILARFDEDDRDGLESFAAVLLARTFGG